MNIDELKEYISRIKDIDEVRRVLKEHGFLYYEPDKTTPEERIAKWVGDEEHTSREILKYAIDLAKIGRWEAAEEAIKTINEKIEQERGYAELALKAAEYNQPFLAENLMSMISENRNDEDVSACRFSTLLKNIENFLGYNERQKTIEYLIKIEEELESWEKNDDKGYTFAEIAEFWMKLEQKEKAIDLWNRAITIAINCLLEQEKLKRARLAKDLFITIGYSIARSGGIELAKEIVNSIKYETGRELALKGIEDFTKYEPKL